MSKIKIQAARLSFPSLFEHSVFSGESTGKFEATFILDKTEHAKTIAEIKSVIDTMIKENLKGLKLPPDKICLKDGDESGRPELEGKYIIKGTTKRRPVVINRDKTPLTEEDNVLYPGCYVNGIISLWAQDNRFGKRINCNLEGVQFVRDGEPFGEGSISVDDFDDFGAPFDDEF